MQSFLKSSLALGATMLLLEQNGVQAESMYNPIKSAVSVYNAKNFEKQVTMNREKGISIVQFYKGTESNSKRDKGQYEKFAIEHEKMFRIGSVNCEDFSDICSKEGITEYPSYRVYPEMPIPVLDYVDTENELDTDKLRKMAYKWVGNRVIEITSNNHDTFKNDNPGKPKMLLFSEKKGTPIVYRALSTYFDVSLSNLLYIKLGNP